MHGEPVSRVNTRSFVVPKGSAWPVVPMDGGGPIVAREGETVLIVVAHSYEKAIGEALRRLATEPDDAG
jgi:hypothetical protein